MAEDFAGRVQIVEVDVDKSENVAKEYKVEAMPTLVLMRGDKEVDRVLGANEDKIREMIQNAL